MKKLLLALSLVFGLQLAYAQQSVYSERPDRLYSQGKEMFLVRNYVGAIQHLEEFVKQSKNAQLIQEAEYMILNSTYRKGETDSAQKLKDYITKYPSTQHLYELGFLIGSSHFASKEWNLALYWLGQSDANYLTGEDKEDYLYRLAYATLQEGNRGVARNHFSRLTASSKKYGDAASYYLAYIDFQEGKYDQAIAVFKLLKDKPEFRENAWFFLTQSAYLKQDYKLTINEAQKYLSAYPNTPNIGETSRLLGSSYYQEGDADNAIKNYERYVASEAKPFREDMYQLGELYYKRGDYTKSINALKKSASVSDLLGQAGNMMLGQCYQKMGDTNNALLAFDAAARATHSETISEEALYNYVMLTNQGTDVFGQSITAFQQFLTKYPHSKHIDNINSALASTLLSTNNYQRALDVIGTINRPGRQLLDAKQVLLYQVGVQNFINGDYTLAINQFDSSISLGNYNMEAKKESFFWRAEALYRQDKYKEAASDYSSYVAEVSMSEKNYLPALYNLGYSYFQTKDYNKALSSFSRYTSMETDKKKATYSDALNRVGDCYLFRRDFSTAEKYYSDATSADPKNADYAQFQRAFVLGLQHKYKEKVQALNSMMSSYPSSPYYANALFEKSRAHVMLNQDKEAITILEQLLRDHPQSALASKSGVQLGQLYFNNNNTGKAIVAYKKVVADFPNTGDAQIALNSLEGAYKDLNDVNSYVSYVNSLGGGHVITASRQDTLTFQAAENVYMRGRKTESKKAFENYLTSFSKGRFVSDANFYLGNMVFEENNKAKALPHFKEVIASRNPKYLDDALIFASGIEYDNRNYQSAYEMYQLLNEATANQGNRDVAQLGMLRTAYLLKHDDEVISSAKKILENKNISADVALEARFYKGKSLLNSKKQDEALKDLKIVGENTRTAFGAESQFLMAKTLFAQKQYDTAETQVLSFMKAGTPHGYWMARTVIVLSDVYKAKGDNFQARQYLESLQANYKGGETDITEMLSERLASLDN